MPFTLSGALISTAVVRFPAIGVWVARVGLAEEKLFATGDRVILEIGDLVCVGTVRSGGSWISQSEYLVVGGADGWAKRIKQRAYRADNGVRLSAVAFDLAADAGERIVVGLGVERILGYAWTRPRGTGAEGIFDLRVPWWVGLDGITYLGDRLPILSGTASLSVEYYSPSRRRAVVSSPDDILSPLMPGGSFSTPDVAPFTIWSSTVRVAAGRVVVEVQG